MAEDPPAGAADPASTDEVAAKNAPPGKMGLGFYAALGLIGILVVMVVVINYPAARAHAGMEMTKTSWTLRSLTDNTGIHIPAQSGTEVTAAFDLEGRMSVSAGCNRYSASYQARDYRITISEISLTKMFCHGPGVMEQESAFLADLSATESFRISGSSLKLYDASGKTVLVFAAA